MNKSKVAVALVVVLGATWIGGAWYTGKTAESEYRRQIEYVNQKMAVSTGAEGVAVKIDNVKFERGLFSSDFSYDILIKPAKEGEESWTLPFEGKLHHGPLPLDRLSKLNVSPVMFSATTQIVKNDTTKTWFEATGGKNPAVGSTVMNYSQRMSGDFSIAGGKLNYQGVDMSWTDAAVVYDTDKNGDGRYDYKIGSVKAFFNEESLQTFIDPEDASVLKTMDLEMTDLKGEYEVQPTALQKIFIGESKVTIGNMKYAYTYKDETPPIAVEFKNTAFDYNAAQNGDFLNYALKNKSESISLNQKPLGELQLDIQLNHLSAKVMNDLAAMGANDSQVNQAAGLELLKNQPHLQISPLKLTTPNGKIEAGLNIELANADFAQALQGKILSLFKQLNVQFSADKSALENTLSVFAELSGISKEEADQFAKEEMDALIQEGVQQQLIVSSDKDIGSTLLLENGELKFNGNVIPEEHIGMFLMGLMMQ